MATAALPSPASSGEALPELCGVAWRPRVDERRLEHAARLWTLSAAAHTIPFIAIAVGLMLLQPLAFPVAAVALLHAWVIPALYAQRGANVIRPKRPLPGAPADPVAERTALGLLGDLVGHRARDLLVETGLVMEKGAFGTWLLGEGGAVLVRPGGRQIMCYCVRVSEPGLPVGDRIAHLLLALRSDESGFATVANLAFAGARWRLRRRLPARLRPALAAAALAMRADG